jgi:predicted nucleotidyltransferase
MKKDDFAAIARALNDVSVPFIVVGGVAVIEHGYGRNTYDVDLVLHLTRDAILRCFDALAALGYQPRVPITAEQFADPDERRRILTEKQMQVLNFWSDDHRQTPLDLFVTEPFVFEEEYEKSEEREVAPGLSVRIVSLGTLLDMKRVAGRPKDLADIDELSLLHGLPSSYDEAD